MGRWLLALALTLGFVSVAHAGPYYNSSETGCDGSNPNVILCDDFQRDNNGNTPGTWYVNDGNNATAADKGWFGTIFNNPITPAGAIVCGGGVYPFGNCVTTAGPAKGGTRNTAQHRFKTATCGTNGFQFCDIDEIFVRWYMKWDAGYVFGNEKLMTITNGDADIAFMTLLAHCNSGGTQSTATLNVPYNYGSFPGSANCQPQNLGNNITAQSGRWYFFEIHVRAGIGNAIIELWVNDCGVSPANPNTACGTAPILRAGYYNGSLPGNVNGSHINMLWMETWNQSGAFQSQGTGPYKGNLKVSRVGPIGFAGTTAPPSAFGLPGGAGQGIYTTTGAVVTVATPLPGPTLIGFVHRATLLVTILALLILIRRRTHAPR